MISPKKILNLESRRKIYDFISKNPGTHVSNIAKELNLSKTAVIYHLKMLKKLDLIEEKTHGMYKRVYIVESIGSKEKELVGLLRQDTPRKIFIYLGFSISFTQAELSKELNLSASTINHHLNKFIKLGIIEKTSITNGAIPVKVKKVVMIRKNVSNEVFYRRKEQWPLNVMWKFLVKNKDSFYDKEFIKSYETYLKNSKVSNEKMPNKLKSIDSYFNGVENVFNEIFPLPFVA